MAAKKKPTSPSNGEKTVIKDDARQKNGQFGKGNTCGGRKKLPQELVEMCRELTPEAINTARRIMLDESAKDGDRLRAAELIVDRAYGKPRQAVDVDMETAPRVVFVGIDEVKD